MDQAGRIWRIDLTVASPVDVSSQKPFLDVSSQLVTLGALGPDTFDERGLLGLAFHPNFQSNGKFYTYMSVPAKGSPTLPSTLPAGTPPDHQNVLAEWTKKGNRISGPRILMRVDWPQFNHDGGDLAFGPDGKLYISMGDGGGADDRDGQDFLGTAIVGHGNCGNAQNLGNPLGKILRIDVDGHSPGKQYGIPSDNPFVSTPGAVQEIYAHGLRNPYRMSFDATTGVLYVGDVGQNDIEEVNVVVSGGNYGWNFKEGTLFFDTNGNADGFATEAPSPTPGCSVPAGVIDPIAQYDNHHEGHSGIGGFAYRGTQLLGLNGHFIFGDYSRLFKLPGGPHDYGRLFHINPGGAGGLAPVHEFHITPSNAPNIAASARTRHARFTSRATSSGSRSALAAWCCGSRRLPTDQRAAPSEPGSTEPGFFWLVSRIISPWIRSASSCSRTPSSRLPTRWRSRCSPPRWQAGDPAAGRLIFDRIPAARGALHCCEEPELAKFQAAESQNWAASSRRPRSSPG